MIAPELVIQYNSRMTNTVFLGISLGTKLIDMSKRKMFRNSDRGTRRDLGDCGFEIASFYEREI